MKPKKYTKIPVTIEAKQVREDMSAAQWMDVYQWVERYIGSAQPSCDGPDTGVAIDPEEGAMVIRTLEGGMKVSPGAT